MKRRTFCLSAGIFWIATILCITSVVSFCGSAHAGSARLGIKCDWDRGGYFQGYITYDTEVQPTVVIRKGEKRGEFTAAQNFYGYSKAGITDVNLDYIRATWTKDDIVPSELLGIEADLWVGKNLNSMPNDGDDDSFLFCFCNDSGRISVGGFMKILGRVFIHPWTAITFYEPSMVVNSLLQETYIDFVDPSGDYPPPWPRPRFTDARVYSFQNGDGTVGTNFFARLTGPSPEDITLFRAVGPSGTLHLGPGYSFQDSGLTYRCDPGMVVEDGTYTFTATDMEGRTATIQKTFTYDGTVPAVDAASITPANLAYVGTTTPTLSAAPVAGDYRYQILVWDMGGKAVWYSALGLRTPTVTIPEGVLQPTTAYGWAVRVWDVAGENYRAGDAFYFFTGTKGDPTLELASVLSFPSSEGIENFPYARSASTAPWDMETFTVTDPDGQVYSLRDFQLYSFNVPVIDAALEVLDPPVSFPDGTYQFQLTDKAGKTATQSATYAYHPVPDFLSEARVPEDNAYFDTQRPTFSWDRVAGDTGDGAYLYSVRITDYSTDIRWYESPRIVATSFTLPADLNLPKGSSYKWRVCVLDASGNNYRSTDYRTFTINGPVYPVCNIKANGSDGPVTASSSEPVSITVTLDPGQKAGENANWWCTAYTPFEPPANWFSYVSPGNWKEGTMKYDQFELFSLSTPFDVLYATLPVGKYFFFFTVQQPDGASDDPFHMMDTVEVDVR